MFVDRKSVNHSCRNTESHKYCTRNKPWCPGGKILYEGRVGRSDRMSLNMKPLYLKACEQNNHSLVRELLSKVVDVNWRDADDWAGLHIAAYDNYGELLELLLAQTGVDVNIRTNNNYTPLMWACREGHENIVRRLSTVTGITLNSRNVNV